jgi:hypothetical protein
MNSFIYYLIYEYVFINKNLDLFVILEHSNES